MAGHDQRRRFELGSGLEEEEKSAFDRELSEAGEWLDMLKESLRRSSECASSLIAEREDLLSARNRIPALEGSLAEREGEISRLVAERDTLAVVAGRVPGLEQSLADRESEVSRLAFQRDALLASTSWRITGPLRWVVTGARQRVRRWQRSVVRLRRGFSLRVLRRWRRDARLVASSGFFDARWYLKRNPDVAASGVEPLEHFVKYGAAEGRDPHPLFSIRQYEAENPDVVTSGINALVHFVLRGPADGRRAPAAEDRWSRVGSQHTYTVRERVLPSTAPAEDRPLVLCVTHVRPWPRRAGNEYRLGRLLDWLVGRGHQTLVVLAPLEGRLPAEAETQEMARRYGNVVACLPDGRVETWFSRPGLSLAHLAGQQFGRIGPRESKALARIEAQFCHDALVGVALELERAVAPCVLYANYVFMTRWLPLTTGKSVSFVDTIDVFSTKGEKVGRFGIRDPLCLSPQQEGELLRRADAIVAIQAEEKALLAKLVPDRPVLMAGLDFDTGEAEPIPSIPTVLCVASDNALNVRGLRDFLRFAWPIIRREVPEARLGLVGSAAAAVELSGEDGVEAHGLVDDVAPLYRDARVAINPAVAGTGIKVKTMEGLRHFRPVVTFPHGVDGVTNGDLRGLCRVVTDWYEFAWTTVDILRRGVVLPDAEGQARIREALSPDAVYEELGRWLDDATRQVLKEESTR